MKKLINNPEDAVRQSLEGMVAAHVDKIRTHFEPNFVYRADERKDRMKLRSSSSCPT